MSRNRWLIELAGDSSDLKELSKSLKSDVLSIASDDSKDCYVLKSSNFDSLEDYQEVYKEAKRLIVKLNGPAKLALGSGKPVRLTHVIEVLEDNTRKLYGFGDVNVTMPMPSIDMSFKMGNGTIVEVSQAAPVPSWIDLVDQNKQVEKVFHIFSKENLDWTDLYNIYEMIQDDIEGKIYKQGWITDNQETCFTQTANYYRHGKSTFKLPDKPMTSDEANSLISYIMQRWLEHKAST